MGWDSGEAVDAPAQGTDRGRSDRSRSRQRRDGFAPPPMPRTFTIETAARHRRAGVGSTPPQPPRPARTQGKTGRGEGRQWPSEASRASRGWATSGRPTSRPVTAGTALDTPVPFRGRWGPFPWRRPVPGVPWGPAAHEAYPRDKPSPVRRVRHRSPRRPAPKAPAFARRRSRPPSPLGGTWRRGPTPALRDPGGDGANLLPERDPMPAPDLRKNPYRPRRRSRPPSPHGATWHRGPTPALSEPGGDGANLLPERDPMPAPRPPQEPLPASTPGLSARRCAGRARSGGGCRFWTSSLRRRRYPRSGWLRGRPEPLT